MPGLIFRVPEESDYPDVLGALEGWWGEVGGASGGATRSALLPRLFFQHFTDTSLVVHDRSRLVAFLVGFLSQSRPDETYIHFVGVDPAYRSRGLGTELYERFFTITREHGRHVIRAITSIPNTGSQAFHVRMGFTVSDPIPDYAGSGGDRVTFLRVLDGA